MLKHDIKVGDSIQIGDAVITIRAKSGQNCTLMIDAPKHILVQPVSARDKKGCESQPEPN